MAAVALLLLLLLLAVRELVANTVVVFSGVDKLLKSIVVAMDLHRIGNY